MTGRPRLPRRLRTVCDLVPPAAWRVADVGAGHGALAVHLSGIAKTVIATESQPGPYAELCHNLDAWDARGAVESRFGAGLAPLHPGEVDAVIVAGVGARTALGICAEARAKQVRWMVLQCMQRGHLVDPWMAERGWPVLVRVDATDRRRTYPTWLVEVRP